MTGPIARIVLRYGVGLVAGMAIGDQLAADPDLVLILSAGIAALVEGAYAVAKRRGWTT